MATKQTAVEWLEQELDRQCMIKVFAWEDEQYFRKLLDKAKQMEKEHIKDAFTDGCIGELYELNAYYTSEKYYNFTYGSQAPQSLEQSNATQLPS